MNKPLVTVGVLLHNGEKYLDLFLSSLLAQDYKNLEILLLDNASKEDCRSNIEDLCKNSDKKIILDRSEDNLGFAAGHNLLINNMNGDFYLCLNQDIILKKNFISEMVEYSLKNPLIGAVSGKLYKWDFPRNLRTDIIDTLGIEAFKSHYFRDIAQGLKDEGQYAKSKKIFGVSGAAAFYRKEALEDVVFVHENGKKEYFDESFFMYKEDIDLSYRLLWAGWQCRYNPDAIGWHDRTIAKKKGFFAVLHDRNSRPKNIKIWSAKNHKLLIAKNFSKNFNFKIKFNTYWRNLFTSFYLLLFEPKVLLSSRLTSNDQKEVLKKREQMKIKVNPLEIEKLLVSR